MYNGNRHSHTSIKAPLVFVAMSGFATAGATPTAWQPPQMGLVSAGTYEMGCTPPAGRCFRESRPVRTVILTRSYEVMEHEVTQDEYESLMGVTPSFHSHCGGNCPVDTVNWLDAVRYANAASTAAGLESCYEVADIEVTWSRGFDCTGYRLPTEPEWEYSSRSDQCFKSSGSKNYSLRSLNVNFNIVFCSLNPGHCSIFIDKIRHCSFCP